VGNGASPELIEGCARQGKGRSLFVGDQDDISGKIVSLLEQTLSPVADNFKLTYN